jgi:hypothetical protein
VPVATMLELYIGITAACLPLLAALIGKAKPPVPLNIGRGATRHGGDSEADLLAWTPETKLKTPNPLKTVYHYPLSSEVGPWNARSSLSPLPTRPTVPMRELSNASWSSDEIWVVQEAIAAGSVTPTLPGSAF